MACIYGIEQPCDECRMCTEENHMKKQRKTTNAEKIRSMGIAELAAFLCRVKEDFQWTEQEFPSGDACGDWEGWLGSEVTE